MIKLTEREKKMIIGGVAIILLFLIYNYIASPFINHIITLKKDFDMKYELVKNLDIKKKDITNLKETVEKDAVKLETVYSAIPLSKNTHEIIVDFETFVEDNKLIQHTFTVLDIEEEEIYYKIPIRIRVSGQFSNIITFLRNWEDYERFVSTKEIRMSSDKDTDIIITELLAEIYTLKTEHGFTDSIEHNIIDSSTNRKNPFSPIP